MVLRKRWRRKLTPLNIALLYLGLGFTALFLSDVVVPRVLEGDLKHVTQAMKGSLEILLSAVFIYGMLHISWSNLKLKERAMDAAPIGISIAEPGEDDDDPLIYVNSRFESLTGYEEAETLGRDCRFLQGPDTDSQTVGELREAIDQGTQVSVDIKNYRKNDEIFWNKVDIAPIVNDAGTIQQYVGFQQDITERKIREQRLAVLNRILRHTYRNQMNVIHGYVNILKADIDDDHRAIEPLENAIAEIEHLAESAQRIEAILQQPKDGNAPFNLRERMQRAVAELANEYPDAEIHLDIEQDLTPKTTIRGFGVAIEEALRNAIIHNNKPNPEATITCRHSRDGWLNISITDNGPGIPDQERASLRQGESQLQHSTSMGLWMMQWITIRAGGHLKILESDKTGTTLEIKIPVQTADT